MASIKADLSFDGYWRDEKKSGLPRHSGVYCVYTCTHNEKKGTVSLKKLIYIGEAGDVRDRVENHEKRDRWKRYLRDNQQLCYSTAQVESTYRERVEAALIFEHKPPVNDEYVDSFPFDRTTVVSKGETAKLNTHFTVDKTQPVRQ